MQFHKALISFEASRLSHVPNPLQIMTPPPGAWERGSKHGFQCCRAGQLKCSPAANCDLLQTLFCHVLLCLQDDNHLPEMSVRQTLDFAARCQGPAFSAPLPFPHAPHVRPDFSLAHTSQLPHAGGSPHSCTPPARLLFSAACPIDAKGGSKPLAQLHLPPEGRSEHATPSSGLSHQ